MPWRPSGDVNRAFIPWFPLSLTAKTISCPGRSAVFTGGATSPSTKPVSAVWGQPDVPHARVERQGLAATLVTRNSRTPWAATALV